MSGSADPTSEPTVAAILLSRDSGGAFAPARCLAAAGLRFHLVAGMTEAAVRLMRGCAGVTRVRPSSFEESDGGLQKVLCALLATHPQAVVVPVGMPATTYLARISPALPPRQVFPLAPEPLLGELDDKWSFAAVTQRLGLAHPSTRLLADRADLDTLDMTFPMIVKPLESEGSKGMRWVDSIDELDAVVQRIAAVGLLPVLVQQHIEGHHVAVSGLAEHGKIRASVVHRILGGGDFDFVDAPDADEAARTLVSATGFHGVFNIDFQREAGTGDLFALEINPRLYASVHKDAYAGVNLVELGIRLARGEDFAAPVARREVVHEMSGRLRRLLASRGRVELSRGSRHALRADLRDPMSTVVRAMEHRYRQAGGGQRRPWQKFDDEQRGRGRKSAFRIHVAASTAWLRSALRGGGTRPFSQSALRLSPTPPRAHRPGSGHVLPGHQVTEGRAGEVGCRGLQPRPGDPAGRAARSG
jgi:hypothetical protein